MKIGVIGLGRMGLSIAIRLKQYGHEVIGYDPSIEQITKARDHSIECVTQLNDLTIAVRIFWLMIPAEVVDTTLKNLEPLLDPNDIIIDGGNSFFKDSIQRFQRLEKKNISFIDCGTSGGLHGLDKGFSLMIGGNKSTFDFLQPIFQAIAMPSGFTYIGPSGSGHYVKMIHNGVEYALLQSYAEGFHLLKHGIYKNLNLEEIASVWNHGSIIRSWIVDLAQQIFSKDSEFNTTSGSIAESGTGQWTVDTAKEIDIPIPMIEKALELRAWSRKTDGNYATKLVSLFRHQFGGHTFKKNKNNI